MLGLGSLSGPRPQARSLGSSHSSFHGMQSAFQRLTISKPTVHTPPAPLQIEASRKCDLTGKKANNGYRITFSHKRNRYRQEPNLQKRMIYWPEGQRWVRLKAMADEAGIDLWKLPFRDARPERLAYLEETPHHPPMAKNPRAMKNPAKLAASKKTPLVARYLYGKVVYVREGTDLSKL
ncbi:hypothetical protein QBZ16_000308 [Prototheca wickerhamii]|uniref:Uncharacterized protein n=1 Tax=Prototheca wickerhamii TaxID=3111 RepID=A0AAD9IMZ6_PROWI|nr:hypothetical protein QBZ16_000308 [Prototheca wickerhamii]